MAACEWSCSARGPESFGNRRRQSVRMRNDRAADAFVPRTRPGPFVLLRGHDQCLDRSQSPHHTDSGADVPWCKVAQGSRGGELLLLKVSHLFRGGDISSVGVWAGTEARASRPQSVAYRDRSEEHPRDHVRLGRCPWIEYGGG